jgi:hypothetical protein
MNPDGEARRKEEMIWNISGDSYKKMNRGIDKKKYLLYIMATVIHLADKKNLSSVFF